MTIMQDAAQLFGAAVSTTDGENVGTVDGVWVDDATNQPEFIGVKTGWLAGKTHLIPLENAQFSGDSVQVPYGQDQIKDAPSFDTDAELSPSDEETIYSYYGLHRSTNASPTGYADGSGVNADVETSSAPGNSDATYGDRDRIEVPLAEEELTVGKRQVEAGRVRLRKVVQTEQQQVPVELRRESVRVERVEATDATLPHDAFQEREVEVPVMREEPVVAKETHVTGGVRLNKDVQTETRTVGGEVRKEDVEVDRGTVDTYTTTTDDRLS